jgi:G3E family GTPase
MKSNTMALIEGGSSDIPLTVLGGYLGAGKTTLLNRLLGQARGQRYGVVVNDFGAISIDEALIENREGETLSLRNGCICCSIRSDLGEALERLTNGRWQLDQVIVEASGTADPERVAATARNWPGYRWSGSFVVVDGEQGPTQIVDKFVGRHVAEQIAHANVLVLSKLDRMDEAGARAARSWLKKIAQNTPILKDIHALPEILCEGATLSQQAEMNEPLRIESHAIRFEGKLDIDALVAALRAADGRILRAKGLVRNKEGGDFVVQKVGPQVEILAGRPGLPTLEYSDLVLLAERGFGSSAFASIETTLRMLEEPIELDLEASEQ